MNDKKAESFEVAIVRIWNNGLPPVRPTPMQVIGFSNRIREHVEAPLLERIAMLENVLDVNQIASCDHIKLAQRIRDLESELAKDRAEIEAIVAALPDSYYMDPPDGGSVTVSEQVKRMKAELSTLKAGQGEPVAWACWADGLDPKIHCPQITRREPRAYTQRAPLYIHPATQAPIDKSILKRLVAQVFGEGYSVQLNGVPAGAEPAFTTGHCKEKAKPGGCQLHNLQCGYPECDRKSLIAAAKGSWKPR